MRSKNETKEQYKKLIKQSYNTVALMSIKNDFSTLRDMAKAKGTEAQDQIIFGNDTCAQSAQQPNKL